MRDASQVQAICLGGARVLLSYSLRIPFVFSSYSLRILHLFSLCRPAAAAASLSHPCCVSALQFDTKPGRLYISLFSVSRFGLVSLHDVNRADDPIG